MRGSLRAQAGPHARGRVRLWSEIGGRRYPVGMRTLLVLVALVVGPACGSPEAECHRRAQLLLQCCPFCDEECKISKDAEAQLVASDCLAAAADPEAHQDDGEAPAPVSDEPAEPTPSE